MTISAWPLQERPRERLLQCGAQALSDAELLAIFLRTGVRGKTAVDVARDLLKQFDGLLGLLAAPQETLCQQPGLGPAKYAQLQAALEVGNRFAHTTLQDKDVLHHMQDAKRFFVTRLRHQQREIFACLFLDIQHQILGYEELFQGSLSSAPIYAREVVKRALHHNAAAVIFAHNHPSGCTEPSVADQETTWLLRRALETVDVRVLDHMIVGAGQVASCAELGVL